jgi:hypothetical protein
MELVPSTAHEANNIAARIKVSFFIDTSPYFPRMETRGHSNAAFNRFVTM